MAKDSAFIPTLKGGDFPLRPSQSYKLNYEKWPDKIWLKQLSWSWRCT